jgi:hypothetical protein
VAYDDEYLYAAGWFYDSWPGEVRVNSLSRDRWRGDDTALVQLNSVDDRLGVNLRLRYNFREGGDLWLVYDEGFNADRDPTTAAAVGYPDRARHADPHVHSVGEPPCACLSACSPCS